MAHSHTHVGDNSPLGVKYLSIAERLVVILCKLVLASGKHHSLLAPTATTHIEAYSSVGVKLLGIAHGDSITALARGGEGECADSLGIKMKANAAIYIFGTLGIDIIDLEHLGRLRNESPVGAAMSLGVKEGGVVEIRLGKSDLGATRIVALVIDRFISEHATLGVAGMVLTLEALVTLHHLFPIEIHLTPEHMTKVSRHPYTVDKPLVIAMYRKDVLALAKKIANVYLVIEIRLGIAGSRPFSNVSAVNVELIVIVGTYTQNGTTVCRKCHIFPVYHVLVAKVMRVRCCDRITRILTVKYVLAVLVKLDVIHVDRLEIIEIRM